MNAYIRIIALLSALAFLLIFISMVRKRSVKPFYSVLWLLISFAMFGLVIFEKPIKWFSLKFGFSDASGLVIVGVIFFLLVYVLHLSLKLCEVADRLSEVISMQAIHDGQIRDLNISPEKETED